MSQGWEATRLLLRQVALGGLAGLIAGVFVAGVGGRIVMRLAALIDPTATGAVTSNGNRVGEITLEGTLALIVFEGILAGVFAGVEWVIVSPWVPRRGLARHGLAAALAIAAGAAFVVRMQERDFGLLDPAPLVVVLFVGLIGLLGAVTSVADGWLRARFDRGGPPSRGALAAYAVLTGLGLLLAFAVANAYFDAGFARPRPWVGALLVVTGLATVALWVAQLRRRPGDPASEAPSGTSGVQASESPGPARLRIVGSAGIAGLLVVGGAGLWSEVAGILEAASR